MSNRRYGKVAELDRLRSKGRPSETAPALVERTLQTSVDDWLRLVAGTGSELGTLLAQPPEEQGRRGHLHTLREITQQPYTWIETARNLVPRATELRSALGHVTSDDRPGFLALTGSGSSLS